MFNYLMVNCSVDSEFELPEVIGGNMPSAGAPEIIFAQKPVELFRYPDFVGDKFQTQGNRDFILTLPQVGKFRVQDGRRIDVDAAESADPLRLRLNLMGLLQSVLWHMRDKLALHGTVLDRQGQALVVCGASGVGKSIFSMALWRHGLKIISDDFAVVSVENDLPLVYGTYTRLRLWRGAVDAFGLKQFAVGLAHPGGNKIILHLPDEEPLATPSTVRDIIILARGTRAPAIERVMGLAKVQAILEAVHFQAATTALGMRERITRQVIAILKSDVRVWAVKLPDELENVAEVAETFLKGISDRSALQSYPETFADECATDSAPGVRGEL